MCDAISEMSSIPRPVCGPGPTSGQPKILGAGLTGKEPPSVCWVHGSATVHMCVCVFVFDNVLLCISGTPSYPNRSGTPTQIDTEANFTGKDPLLF